MEAHMAENPKGVADHPCKIEMETLWRQGFRAKSIVGWLQDSGYPPVKVKTLSRYGQRYWSDDLTLTEEVGEMDTIEDVHRLIEEIEASGLGTVKQITVGSKKYPGWRRDHPDDVAVSEAQESVVRSIRISPPDPSPFVEARVADVTLNYEVREFVGKEDGWSLGVFLPDMQMGYWNNNGELITTHDEAAMDIAHQIMADAEQMYGIDVVVNAGDNIDFPALGSYRVPPALLQTTQLAIDRAATEAATQRILAPNARNWWLEGNHERRMTSYLIDKAAPLVALRKANDPLPALSVASLCRFDEFGIEYIDPYPDGEIWINDHLRFEHGSLYANGPGSTAAKHLRNGVSVGYGHIHRQEMLHETRHTARGPRTHFAGSPGCLCRIDGIVPSSKTGITSEGLQAGSKSENWQQGLWVFWFQSDGKQLVSVDEVSIWGGWARWQGRDYFATVDPNGNPL